VGVKARVLSSFFVVLSEDVCFSDISTEFFVRGRVIASDTFVDALSFVFVPDPSLLDRGLICANAIVTPVKRLIPVRMIKPECGDVYLRKGTRVGELISLNEENGFYENFRLISDKKTVEPRKDALCEINVGSLSRDDRQKLLEVLREFEDVFSATKMDIGCTHLVEHKIDTGGCSPVATPIRRIPMALEEKVDKMIDDLLQNDIIQPSESPWNAPIVIVAEKNGDIHLCVDYRRLNAVTKRAIYPIPSTQQLLDCLEGSVYFSTLDMSQGYHQIPMAAEDQQKTAFATRRGQFAYKRMPFGLSTAPATFQRLMHLVLRNENWEKCLIYLDDVLIFGRSADEHLTRLRAVLQRFREAGLKLSPSKCYFMQKEVEYLGHIVTGAAITTDGEKVDKVRKWPAPTTVKELRSFLSFCNYYR
jgi:hypothetical protein